ncbi:uncharacterized protein LOC120286456 [Eucalyptus grandis]|uniref:uncharacterized protein LOC120286456 n=1 Tax=Eucalyptus grandis TaxID=71139 RepID=UPI00192E8D3A|nr:uncharacterized protein LOC120286456 [Eucalyptus grandis]
MEIEEIGGLVPSSSASVHRWKYDVFVSFRGGDIRKTFAAHLFHALKQAGIYYFGDNEKKETGILIEGKLLVAIRHSRVSLVVFTTSYADSRWCLNELVEILECNRRFRDHQGHVVLPIFYYVEPRDVRKQSGRFGDGFERCLATHTDDLLVQKWRDSLKEAGNLSGWHLNNDANVNVFLAYMLMGSSVFHRANCRTSRKDYSQNKLPDTFGVGLWKYDVFVSFRGGDIRKNFAAHLFHALKQAGIYYFGDNEKKETGILIEGKLLVAIHHSRVSLVVFTANYADSRWCLNELVEILECNRRFRDHQGHVVLPIFYDVEPRNVRKQSGQFGDGFERCLAIHTDDLLVQKWRDSLKEAGNLSGWHLNNDANG